MLVDRFREDDDTGLKLRIHEQYFCCDGYAMGDNSIALPSHKVATPAIFHLQYMSS
jgi:hypothetical protein